MVAEKVGWGAYHDGYPCARLDTTVAGACSVILKVFFDEGALMSNCVHAAGWANARTLPQRFCADGGE